MATHNDHPLPPPPQGGPAPQQHFPFQAQTSPSYEQQEQQLYQQQWPQQPQHDVFQQQTQYHQQQHHQQYQQPQAQQPQPTYQQPQRQLSSQSQYPVQAQAHPQASQQPSRPSQGKGRPKSRAFSFRSDKSSKNGGPLVETHAEKESNRLQSKADPTLAMNELEPATVAAGVRSSLASLRATAHKDTYGNPIIDPDQSNPTRSRWERPLDTIRSFEASIDGGYKNRHSMIRSNTDNIANWNRRSSYYGGNGGGDHGNPRFPRDSYYGHSGGGRPVSTLPTHSQYDLRQGTPGADSYYDNPGPYGNPGQGRQRYSRMASEPHFNPSSRQQESSVYPTPMNHRSYETVASGSGSGMSADPAGYQTDPTSSDNSSVERVPQPPPKRQEPMDDYGIGFSQQTQRPPQFSVGLNQSMVSPPPGAGGPQAPYKDSRPAAQPMRQPSSATLQKRPDMGEKRKSWFARRFSKHS